MARVTASRSGPNLVRLHIAESLFRSQRVVYASWDGKKWTLSSGRSLSRSMLNAIDGLPISFEVE